MSRIERRMRRAAEISNLQDAVTVKTAEIILMHVAYLLKNHFGRYIRKQGRAERFIQDIQTLVNGGEIK